MRSFLIRVGVFAVALGVLAVACTLLNDALWRFHRPLWPDPPRVLLAGDSHMAMSIDPERIPRAVSIARNRELMVFTHYKLLEVLDAGYEPDVVVLSVAPHNFSTAWERDALNRPETAFEAFAVYFGLVPWFETGLEVRWSSWLAYLAKNRLTPNLHLLGDLAATLAGNEAERAHEYLGGFDPERGGELVAERLELGLAQYYGAGDPPASAPEVEHFERLVDLTRREGIDLVLFLSPARPEQRMRVPAGIERTFRSLVERAATSPHVRVLDLTDLEIPDDAWANHDHVNLRGAAIVSDSVAAALAR
jgi:hypothetical protein